MDNSQSSGVFYDNSMEMVNYSDLESDTRMLLSKTKILLTKSFETDITKLSSHFCEVINNCASCILQSLELITETPSDFEMNMDQVCEHLENAISILNQLSTFITKVAESSSMSCCNMKVFPTKTGTIIADVFKHCKESESIYGVQLSCVEKQLKDLFRTCHELQMVYLMVLEKHFIFDLTVQDELKILDEALLINLEIGRLVQTLDVKTMAEQWKAYTMICEKYSDFLINGDVFYKCAQSLCGMTEDNIKTALEENQEDKIVLRSLKVASFTIKILLRLCNIFKNANTRLNSYQHIYDLLLFVYRHIAVYVHSTTDKSPQFINAMNANVAIPCEALIKELVFDEQFVNFYVTNSYDLEKLDGNDTVVSYILMTISVMKYAIGLNHITHSKIKLIECVFSCLEYGHICFNMGLKFDSIVKDTHQSCGLYEHLLLHTFALASTLDSDHMVLLERQMYEMLLSRDSYGAMFTVNLWELLARISPGPYVLNQLIALCKIYQSLEKNIIFKLSPQKVHLSHIIQRLFENLPDEGKHRFYKQFDLNNDNNISVWSVIRVRNLPLELLNQSEELITEKLKTKFHKVFTTGVQSDVEIDNLIDSMKLAASCSYSDYTDRLEDYIIKAWLRACPNDNKFLLSKELYEHSVWYIEYVAALIDLTMLMKYVLQNSANFLQVFHVISIMIEKGVDDLKLALINLILNMSTLEINGDYKTSAELLLKQTFKRLIQDPDNIVKSKFYTELRKFHSNKNVNRMISILMNEDQSFRTPWNNLKKHGTLKSDKIDLKHQLNSVNELEFSHKCAENIKSLCNSQPVSILSSQKGSSNNFEFADVDSLFGGDTEEPACKRMKLNTNNASDILTRLENDVTLLCDIKENVFPRELRDRIRYVCEKLLSVIE